MQHENDGDAQACLVGGVGCYGPCASSHGVPELHNIKAAGMMTTAEMLARRTHGKHQPTLKCRMPLPRGSHATLGLPVECIAKMSIRPLVDTDTESSLLRRVFARATWKPSSGVTSAAVTAVHLLRFPVARFAMLVMSESRAQN